MCFAPYSKHSSVNITVRPHISLCLPQHQDYHEQHHQQQNPLNNSQDQVTLMLHSMIPFHPV